MIFILLFESYRENEHTLSSISIDSGEFRRYNSIGGTYQASDKAKLYSGLLFTRTIGLAIK